MNWKIFCFALVIVPFLTAAQEKKYTKADTLRGSLNENRDWWNVLHYDIEVTPDFASKSIRSVVVLSAKPIRRGNTMQIDLQKPLIADSIFLLLYPGTYVQSKINLTYRQEDNIILATIPNTLEMNKTFQIIVYYHGTPKAAKNAPWDGGWIWKKDSLNRPWMSAAVQGLGASAWYPCKDYQGDEPDNGASLTVIVPDTLVAVGNGKPTAQSPVPGTGLRSYTWEVKNPINNYNIIPYIGKYVNWTDTLMGEKGKLDLSYWVLDYHLERSKQQFQQVKPMLRCFEHWFGPYPFYEDSYKLVEAPHLGMEHQSAVAYGNGYQNGYRGSDLSGSGWGLKWDFIIVHESGHEWFANNITTNDIADMWVHESFTNYSETLYTEWLFGQPSADAYNFGTRKRIRNDEPIIGPYGVNKEGSGDMYYKGGNMIHTIRKIIHNDEIFRNILRGLNETFWHQTVTTQQIEKYIIKKSGIHLQKTFDQYLRTTQVPELEFYTSNDGSVVYYRWVNCIDGFDMPLVINGNRYHITTKWKSSKLRNNDLSAWNTDAIVKQYYLTAKKVERP